MMHKKNFVAAIKVDGKVLRESSERVELPFGSEYSVLLKNLDTVRQQALVSIDGKEVGGWLVLNPGEQINLERFFKDNRERGHKFKFIERTAAVEDHRGIEAEDGLVRVEFKREKVYEAPKVTESHHYYYDHYYPWPYWNRGMNTQSTAGALNNGAVQIKSANLMTRSSGIGGQSVNSGVTDMFKHSQNFQAISNSDGENGGLLTASMGDAGMGDAGMGDAGVGVAASFNEAGITVNGGLSNQRFHTVSDFTCEPSEVIVLHLVGAKAGVKVKAVKAVQTKLTCDTCGKQSKSSASFCRECGTSLEKI